MIWIKNYLMKCLLLLINLFNSKLFYGIISIGDFMKKISLIVILLIGVISITGCEKTKSTKVISNGKVVDTSTMKHKHCTRSGSVTGASTNLMYDLYYTGDILNIIKSYEEITSDDSSILDEYEEAYKGIHAHYQGIEYYDTSVERNNNSVVSTIVINYDKIDYDRLIALEGEENNIFENRQAKVDKWLELGKKVGVKCEEIEE